MKTVDWLWVGAVVLGACGGPAVTLDAGPGDAGERDAGHDAAILPDGGPPLDAGVDAGGPIVLTNLPASCTAPSDTIEAVLPEEAGHYAATRLTPSSYPFRVTSFDYAVGHPPGEATDCDGGLAHHVSVYVIDGVVPGASPSSDGSLVASFDIAAEAVVDFRSIHRDLSPAVELTTGQSIVIAVQQAADDVSAPTAVSCIAACPGDPSAVPGVDYWSSAAAEPYAWADLVAEFGFPSNLWITATGESP